MDHNPYESPKEANKPSEPDCDPINWWRLGTLLFVLAALVWIAFCLSIPAGA